MSIIGDLATQADKFITERGSAAIMQQRLNLAADEFSVIERKLADKDILLAEKEVLIGNLKAENTTLRLELQDARGQIDGLSEQIQKTKHQTATQRTANENSLLQQIATGNSQNTNQLITATAIGRNVVINCLHQLESDGFVWGTMDPNNNGQWSLTEDGRKYLIDRGLAQ